MSAPVAVFLFFGLLAIAVVVVIVVAFWVLPRKTPQTPNSERVWWATLGLSVVVLLETSLMVLLRSYVWGPRNEQKDIATMLVAAFYIVIPLLLGFVGRRIRSAEEPWRWCGSRS